MIVTSKFLTLFMVLSLIYACTFTSSKNSSKTVNHNKYPLYYDTDSICTYLKMYKYNVRRVYFGFEGHDNIKGE